MSDLYDERTCENCGRWVDRTETLYRVRLDMFAEPTVKIEDPAPPPQTVARRWEDLIQQLEMMSDEQVQEATDQVHERFEFNLCPECRREMHRRIRTRRDLLP